MSWLREIAWRLTEILGALLRIERMISARHNAVGGKIKLRRFQMANPELGTTQKETATANFTDADGNPVTSFPTPPVWASSSPAIVPTPAADGMSASLAGAGTVAVPGVVVTCTGTNADNTTDQLSVTIDVVVGSAGDAVGGSISLGTPTAQ